MVGGYVLEEALARGHTVRALARNAAKLPAYDDRITVVQGDARDPAVVEELVRGSDVVISALGPVRADGDAARMLSALRIDPEHPWNARLRTFEKVCRNATQSRTRVASEDPEVEL